MGTVAFKPLTAAEQIFKSLIWDPMIKAGEVWIDGAEAAVPLLNLPILNGLEHKVIELLTDAIFSQVILLVDVAAIRLVGAYRQAAYDSAFENLAVIVDEQGVDSDAFRKARDEAITALANRAHTGP